MTTWLLVELAALPLAAASALIAYLVASLSRAARVLASHEQGGHLSAVLVCAKPRNPVARPIHARVPTVRIAVRH